MCCLTKQSTPWYRVFPETLTVKKLNNTIPTLNGFEHNDCNRTFTHHHNHRYSDPKFIQLLLSAYWRSTVTFCACVLRREIWNSLQERSAVTWSTASMMTKFAKLVHIRYYDSVGYSRRLFMKFYCLKELVKCEESH